MGESSVVLEELNPQGYSTNRELDSWADSPPLGGLGVLGVWATVGCSSPWGRIGRSDDSPTLGVTIGGLVLVGIFLWSNYRERVPSPSLLETISTTAVQAGSGDGDNETLMRSPQTREGA